MRNILNSDIYRMTGGEKNSLKRFFLSRLSHQIRYVACLRRYQKKKSIVLRYKLFRLGRKFGLEISTKAEIAAWQRAEAVTC